MESPHILVVEDEALIALDVCHQLAELGFDEVVSAPSAELALEHVKQHKPDLALLDIHLKGDIDGVNLAQEIRLEGNIPIIYMTAYTDKHTISRAVDTAPDGYLVKPISEQELGDAINGILKKKDLEAERAAIEKRSRDLELQLVQAQKMDALGKLTAGIAHELNNSLLVVLGNIELSANASGCSAGIKSYLNVAREGCQRSANLIRKLLSIARHGEYHPQEFYLEDVLASAIDFLTPIIEKNVKLTIENMERDFPVFVDSEQFAQVITNLVLNSQQAFENGGEIVFRGYEARVEVPSNYNKSATLNDYVVLEVIDSGPGISPAELDRIFEPFYSTKLDSQGFGLSIVYTIMQRHGGWVDVNSEVEKGACFRLFFPKGVTSTLGAQSARLTSEEEGKRHASGNNGTVLVIDDELMVVDVISKHLEASGFNTMGFVDPNKALVWYEENHGIVATIIMDMKMPQLAGEECFFRLKEINPSAKIFIFSGFAADDSIALLLNQGAQGFYQKPIDFERLINQLEELHLEA